MSPATLQSAVLQMFDGLPGRNGHAPLKGPNLYLALSGLLGAACHPETGKLDEHLRDAVVAALHSLSPGSGEDAGRRHARAIGYGLAALTVVGVDVGLPEAGAGAGAARGTVYGGFVSTRPDDQKSGHEAAVARHVGAMEPLVRAAQVLARGDDPKAMASAEKVLLDLHTQKEGAAYQVIEDQHAIGGEAAGGATGSARIAHDGRNYQFKWDSRSAAWWRRLMPGHSNVQNLNEYVTSHVAQSLAGRIDSWRGRGVEFVASVDLVHDPVQRQTGVQSAYLEGGTGDLDRYFESAGGVRGRGDRKHVRVRIDASRPEAVTVDKDSLVLSGQAAMDFALHHAMDALHQDNDNHPGQLIMLQERDAKDGKAQALRIGRIDHGHAQGNLIAGFQRFGGGGVADPVGNAARDYFNRHRVLGHPLKRGSGQNKLHRDVDGLVTSPVLSQALRQVVASADGGRAANEGIDKAMAGLKRLVIDLIEEAGKPGVGFFARLAIRRQIDDIAETLCKMSENVGHPVRYGDNTALSVIDAVGVSLKTAYAERLAGLQQVADLSEIQCRVDEILRLEAIPRRTPAEDEALTAAVDAAKELYRRAEQAENMAKATRGGAFERGGVVWLRTSAEDPGVVGTLRVYTEARRQQLGLPSPSAASV